VPAYHRRPMRLRKRPAGGAIQFEAFGVAAEVSYGRPELEAPVRELLPPGWSPALSSALTGRFSLTLGAAGEYELAVDDRLLVQHASLDLVLGALDSEIRMLIATTAPGLIFVHAGVVTLQERALLIPGASFTGKTTLVRALVEVGATYYSDEYAVLDHAGSVLPYPRRLSIRATNGTPSEQRHAHELGGTAGEVAADVSTVVITRYRAGASWQPQLLSNGAGALALLENAVPAQLRPQEALTAISRALTGARVLAGDRGEADAAARALIAEVAPGHA
jgi:hypothetical protein